MRGACPGGPVGVLVLVLAVVLGGAVAAVPASAHGSDPTLVARLTEVSPALLPAVLVQVRTGLSEQMLVVNPTGTPVTVLDPDGIAFLQISSAGVFGNLTARYLHATANPPDAPARFPPAARPGAEPRWVALSRGDAWGWFEHRLHPFVPGGEPAGSGPGPQVVASWQVGMRYGDRPVTVAGVLERRPVTGTFRTVTDPGGDPFDVGIGQGPVPAVHLTVPPGRRVTVGGRDGVPFLRIDRTGVVVNPASVHYQDNPQFHGLPPAPDGWLRVTGAPTVTWLDSRLRYHADRPPGEIANGGDVAELLRWRIPLTVDGQARSLSGRVEWVPSAETAAPARPAGFPWVTIGLGIAATALLVALIALVRGATPVRGGRSATPL